MNLRYLLAVGTSVKRIEAEGARYEVAEENLIPRFARGRAAGASTGRQRVNPVLGGVPWGNVGNGRRSVEGNVGKPKTGRARTAKRDLNQVQVVRNDLTLEDIRLVPAQQTQSAFSWRAKERVREWAVRARALVNRAPVFEGSPFRCPVSKGVKGAVE